MPTPSDLPLWIEIISQGLLGVVGLIISIVALRTTKHLTKDENRPIVTLSSIQLFPSRVDAFTGEDVTWESKGLKAIMLVTMITTIAIYYLIQIGFGNSRYCLIKALDHPMIIKIIST